MGVREGGDLAQVRAMLGFQQRLEKMTKEEMLAALDEINALDLSAEARKALEAMILGPLIEKDPVLALTRFSDRIQSDPDGVGSQLSEALKQWAKQDVAAATAWLDQQIANGTFDSKTLDGRSDMRLQFEGALLANLLSSDPEAAGHRVAKLPETLRREVLQQVSFGDLTPEARNTYAALVRNLVPQDERAGSFAHLASELVGSGGFEGVSGFLDSVNASPQERVAAAMDAANSHLEELGQNGQVTSQDVDAMREWLKKQAPEQMDRITGKALAEAAQDGGEFKFSDAAELAVQYNKGSADDAVLVAFLERFSARSNSEEARHLATMISDPVRREAILNGLK